MPTKNSEVIFNEVTKGSAHSKYKVGVTFTHGYIYLKLIELLKKRCTWSFLKTSEVLEILKMTVKIPRKAKYVTLAEMEAYGLLKRINHQKYYIEPAHRHVKLLNWVRSLIDEGTIW